MIIIHYHRHYIRVSKETTIYWFTWRYQQLTQPQNTQLPKKKVIFKFPFLDRRFILVFNSVTSRNPKLEWDTDWSEQALHVFPLSCGALQSSHRELSEPHGWPGTLNWDPPHTPACTVKNLPQEALQAPLLARWSLHPFLTSPSWMCLTLTTPFPYGALPGALQPSYPATTPALARVILHIEGPGL